MRSLLCFAAIGALAAPAAGRTHVLQLPDAPPAPVLEPLPTVEVTQSAPEPQAAPPPPPPVEPAATPAPPATPPQAPPVLVTKAEDDDGLADKLGSVVGGLAGGAAGAAVAGPVGKFAGGLVGKKLVKGVLGGDDDVPEVTAIQPAPSAGSAAQPAAAAAPR